MPAWKPKSVTGGHFVGVADAGGGQEQSSSPDQAWLYSRCINPAGYIQSLGLRFRGRRQEVRRMNRSAIWLLVQALVIAALPVTATHAVAQGAGATSGVPVHMMVTLEARHGNQPPAISREDVLVYQGHDRVPVTGWTPYQANGADLELYLVIDDALGSGVDLKLNDLRNFIRQLPEAAQVGVAYMRNGTVAIEQKPARDHEAIAKAIRLPQGISAGSPYESLVELIKRWPTASGRREILMVSDGIEPFGPAETSNPYVEKAIETAQRADIPVFTIYAPAAGHWGHTWWRVTWGQTYLSQLADETGGEGYAESGLNPVSFAPYVDDIKQRLQRQYELSFLAKPQKTSGMQRVRVTTEVPNVDLVAADRVFVPAAE